MPGRARPPRRHGKVLAVNAGGGIIAIHAYLGASGPCACPPLAAHIIILSTGHAAMSKRRGQALPSQANHPVVGIGASAGGLSALLEFFEALPARTSMAFVVVMHWRRITRAIWPACCRRPPACASWKSRPHADRPDHVYLIAPSLELTMVDDYLRVAPIGRKRVRRAAIDLFPDPRGSPPRTRDRHRAVRRRLGRLRRAVEGQGNGRHHVRPGAGGSGIRQHAAQRHRDRHGRLRDHRRGDAATADGPVGDREGNPPARQ